MHLSKSFLRANAILLVLSVGLWAGILHLIGGTVTIGKVLETFLVVGGVVVAVEWFRQRRAKAS